MPDTPSAARIVKAPEASSIHSQPSPKDWNDVRVAASIFVFLPAVVVTNCDATSCGLRSLAYVSAGAIPIVSVNDSAQYSAAFPFAILIRCMAAPSFPIYTERKQITKSSTVTISSARNIR